MARMVTVPGACSGAHEPLIVFIEGGVEALSFRLAGEIREALRKLGLPEHEWPKEKHGIHEPRRWNGKSWDVT